MPWNKLEQLIMRVCQQNRLTEPQRDKLDTKVIVADLKTNEPIEMPSPNSYWESSEMFRDFATAKIRTMAANGAPAGRIINSLCNYTHIQGWIAYVERRSPIETIDPPERSAKIVAEYIPEKK